MRDTRTFQAGDDVCVTRLGRYGRVHTVKSTLSGTTLYGVRLDAPDPKSKLYRSRSSQFVDVLCESTQLQPRIVSF